MPSIFLSFVFLSQIFIDHTIGLIKENEIIAEFNKNNILEDLINLNNKMEEFINTKNIDYDYFLSYYFDSLLSLLKNKDCIREKVTIINKFSTLLTQLEEKYKSESENQCFKNMEMNILTSLTYEKGFTNGNLKYLLTTAQYPDLDKLKQAISLYHKKPLPILKAFISIDTRYADIEKLSHIETINNFINNFAEENRNLISRKSSESDSIQYYLEEYRKNINLDEKGQSILDIKFKNFCESYKEITNTYPFIITEHCPVKFILNDDKIKGKETPINKLYSHLIDIQNHFLIKIIDEYNKNKDVFNENIIIKNAIEQIQKEIPIQLSTKTDIFSLNVSNNIILSFEELFSFYSLKNIFEDEDNKINYSKYSEIKFKLNIIEEELVKIILTGKKLFSKKQITYKFFLDPYDVEEKTKKFEKFTELYQRENLTYEEKEELKKQKFSLKKIILPNLENLISYLIYESKYQGTEKINEIPFNSNLYLDKEFIQLFNDLNEFTINKLISIYEFFEEELWDFISDRYINQEFKTQGFCAKYKRTLTDFYNKESERKLKNDLLTSLLIKFVCRYLPYEPKESESKNLFQMLLEKNMNLPEEIRIDLQAIKYYFEPYLRDTIDITSFFVGKLKIKQREEQALKAKGKEEKNKKEEKKDINEIIIDNESFKEEEESDWDDDRDI